VAAIGKREMAEPFLVDGRRSSVSSSPPVELRIAVAGSSVPRVCMTRNVMPSVETVEEAEDDGEEPA